MVGERFVPVECLVGSTRLVVVLGDIVDQDVDAVVNAANQRLKGGCGVDGAIHEAAGSKLLQTALQKIGRCDEGEAVITSGFNLKARYIIHTVAPFRLSGPMYHGSLKAEMYNQEADLKLADCYRNSLLKAKDHGVKTIAFPAIGTGEFEWPLLTAARIAVGTVKNLDFLSSFDEVRFVAYDDEAYNVYRIACKENGLS